MIPIFAGFDPREEYGYHTFCSSVVHHSSRPVTITPLHLDTIRAFYFDGKRDGTNAFTYSRFLVPFFQMWRGWAVFVDGADMLCRGDINELWELRKEQYAVMCVQHNYKTSSHRKYVGTKMESDNRDYPRKNWSSVMLINCAHPSWRCMTPEGLSTFSGEQLQTFEWLPDKFVGELPAVWNWLDEYGENAGAKIVHWTLGIPGFAHYRDAPHADEWAGSALRVTHVTD